MAVELLLIIEVILIYCYYNYSSQISDWYKNRHRTFKEFEGIHVEVEMNLFRGLWRQDNEEYLFSSVLGREGLKNELRKS